MRENIIINIGRTFKMKEIKNVSVIGLGRLGLCIAACLADKGYQVTGVDIHKKKIEQINRGNNHIEEIGLT